MNTDALTFILAQEGAPAPAGAGQTGSPPSMIFIWILMFVIMYFVLIRPQKKRQKELQEKINSLRTGDRVVTSGGIHGLVTNVKGNTLMLKIADNVKIEIEKASVQNITNKTDSEEVEVEAEVEDASSGKK